MSRRFTRADSEQLLDGHGPAQDGLRAVLRAARAAGTAQELAGEDTALAAFRSGPGEPAHRTGRITRRAVAMAAAMFLVLAGAGAAGAAAGVLPSRLQRPAHNILHFPAPHTNQPGPPSAPRSAQPSSSRSNSTSSSPSGSTSTKPSSSSSGAPSPSSSSRPSTSPSTRPSSRPSGSGGSSAGSSSKHG